MAKLIWILISIIAIIIIYLMIELNQNDATHNNKSDEKEKTIHKINIDNKKSEISTDTLTKHSQKTTVSAKKDSSKSKPKSTSSADYIITKDANQFQSTYVPPKKPKYTFKEIQNMNLSDEEKDVLMGDIMAYESYKVRNEPPVLSEQDKQFQSAYVPPKKPKYTFEELENLNLSEEEKNILKDKIVAYESYKVRNEPPVLSKEKETEILKNLGQHSE